MFSNQVRIFLGILFSSAYLSANKSAPKAPPETITVMVNLDSVF
jgi:hypothetical protein